MAFFEITDNGSIMALIKELDVKTEKILEMYCNKHLVSRAEAIRR